MYDQPEGRRNVAEKDSHHGVVSMCLALHSCAGVSCVTMMGSGSQVLQSHASL